MKLLIFSSLLVIYGYVDCLWLFVDTADISLRQMFVENTGRIAIDAICIIGSLFVMDRCCFRLKQTK
jgi:hypothetical protein